MFRRLAVAVLAVGGLAACSAPTANTGQVSDAKPAGEQAAASPAAPAPTWGKRYTWPDGFAVEVAAPVACKPGEYAMPQKVERAVKFKITIINGTQKPYTSSTLSVGSDAQFNSAKAETISDSGGPCGEGGLTDGGTVLPGKSYTYEQSYAVGPNKGEMQLTFEPVFGADKAAFIGQA